MLQSIINKLHAIYIKDGYISGNAIFMAITEANINLVDVEYICDQLLSMGVIIREDPSAYIDDEDENDSGYDRSRTDYNKLFNEVLSIDETLGSFIEQVWHIQPPQHREWQRLLPQAKNGNQYAYRRIILMYLRTVIKIALIYHKKQGADLAEAIQEGCIGLIMALEKYEAGIQEVFPRYFPMWVLQNIQRRITFEANPTVYFPAHVKEKLFSIYQLVTDHSCYCCELYNLCPNLIDIVADHLECKDAMAERYLLYFQGYESIEVLQSINPLLFSDNGVFEGKIIESLNFEELKELIEEVFDSISAREEKVLRLRFGFDDGKVYTLEQVGNNFGVTRERIRQIEKKALNSLSHPNRLKKLRPFWDKKISK